METSENPESPENKIPLDVEEPRSAHESLMHLIISVLILVIVVSGTLNVLLVRLWKNSRDDVRMMRPQYQNFVGAYENNERKMFEKIATTLTAFGATNPDYVPILTKYGFKPSAASSTGPALSVPPPATNNLQAPAKK